MKKLGDDIEKTRNDIKTSQDKRINSFFKARNIIEEGIQNNASMDDANMAKMKDKIDPLLVQKAIANEANDLIDKLTEFSTELNSLCKDDHDDDSPCVFLTELSTSITNYLGQRSRPWEITVVGHSMGAIVLNEAIRRKPYLPIKNIVYMAAASTIRDYAISVQPYLRRSKDTHFYNLMLHPDSEMDERGWGIEPRGSLLVWIDDFLSKPLSIYDRTLGRFNNFLQYVHHIPEKPKCLKERIHIRSFSAGKCKKDSDPQNHSDFSTNYRFWDENCWKDLSGNGCYNRNLMKANRGQASNKPCQ